MKKITKLLIVLFLVACSGFCKAQSNIQLIKKRVVNELMTGAVDDDEIGVLTETLRADGTWPSINYENVSREGFEHRIHTANMVLLARAYKTKSSKYYKNKKVKQSIERALQNWVEHDYFCDNWWHNQIGTTNYLVTLMLLVGDQLDETLVTKAQPIIGRASINAQGARPGGDRIKIAGIEAKNMLFLNDEKAFKRLATVIENEIKYSDWEGVNYGYGFRNISTGFSNRHMGGRGIQYDNSFHHRMDGVNNTISYGMSYADAFAEWAAYTAGTEFAFSQDKLARLIDYYLDGICKTSVYGKYPDVGARNRSISRKGALNSYSAQTAEKLAMTSDYRKRELEEIVAVRNKNTKPTLSHATYFWHSEYFSFQRPNWFSSVRMYSTRNHNMEYPYNSEGFLNHHRGDGTNHISCTGEEYSDIAPVMDYQKIAGTTVMQKPEMPDAGELQKLGLTDFVGAASDGIYGAVAFDFKSPHDPLIVRKAWFFFDQEYVCLGAGISCKNQDFPVVTTLNQCLLRDEVVVSTDGKQTQLEKGEKEYTVDWIYHNKIGYVFPETATVNIKNSEATGSWWRVNKQSDSPKDKIKRDVFMAWINHGIRPSDESYSYIVVPATSIEKLKQNTSKNKVTILANTPEIQAVKQTELKMCQAVFYKAGELAITNNLKLSCASPGIVLLNYQNNGKLTITVSDPNRELGKMLLSISVKIEKEGDNCKAIWNEKKELSEITIDLPSGQFAGSSVTIDL